MLRTYSSLNGKNMLVKEFDEAVDFSCCRQIKALVKMVKFNIFWNCD